MYFAIIILNGSTITLQLTSEQENLCQQKQEDAFVGNSFACGSFFEGTQPKWLSLNTWVWIIKKYKTLENILFLRSR